MSRTDGWREAKLGELFQLKHGYAFKSKYFAEEGPYIVLTPGNFCEEGGFKSKGDSEKFYVGKVPDGYMLKKGDLIVAMTEQAPGLLGSSAIVPSDDLFLHNQRLGLVTDLKEQELDRHFLYYLFNTRQVRSRISATASGTKVRHTSPSRIYEVEVRIPPLSAQRKIAGILSAYDDLIENNTRRIQILEEMAQAIYREWFVHFRFPGHEEVELVDSDLGLVPAGWEVKPLEEVCTLIVGQSPKSKYYNEEGEGLPFHQGVSYFGSRFPKHEVYCTVDKRVAEVGDILFSVRAPVGRINIADRKLIVGRGLHAIRSKKGYQGFILHQLSERFYEEDMMGGGTIFKSVTKADMLSLPLLVPLDSIVEQFEQMVAPMSAQIANLTKKNGNLRETRDLLLPRLVSGKVDVSEMAVDSEPLNH